jgi:hypothetical protein
MKNTRRRERSRTNWDISSVVIWVDAHPARAKKTRAGGLIAGRFQVTNGRSKPRLSHS